MDGDGSDDEGDNNDKRIRRKMIIVVDDLLNGHYTIMNKRIIYSNKTRKEECEKEGK